MRKYSKVLWLAPLVVLLAACGGQASQTSWQDVAEFAVLMFGLAALTWAGRR